MTLIPLRSLMKASVKHRPAQGAFNTNAATQAKAAIQTHKVLRSAAILQGAGLANGSMGGKCGFMSTTLEDKKKGAENIAGTVRKHGENSPMPIILHLDHGRDSDSCVAATTGGYISMMIDGSSLVFDENVELIREAVRYAHAKDVNAEGELGVLTGVEDHVFSEGSTYTNLLKTVESFRKTGVDALAVPYGIMHGASEGKNVKLCKEAAVATWERLSHEDIFGTLVSHGSSTVPVHIVDEISGLGGMLTDTCGITAGELQEATRCGINKINVDTDIGLATTCNMREFLAGNPEKRDSSSIGVIYEFLESKREQFDPGVFLIPIMGMVMTGVIPDEDTTAVTDCIKWGTKEVVEALTVQFGSYGRAPLVEQVSLEEVVERYKKMQT